MSTTPYIPSARQHEITAPQRLLRDGDITEPGFAKHLFWEYDRGDITVHPARIKEWDCYVIGNQERGLVLTMGDCGYVGNLDIQILDYSAGTNTRKSALTFFPMGCWGLPATSQAGDAVKYAEGLELGFYHEGDKRVLRGAARRFGPQRKPLRVDLTLTDLPEETTVIATPLGKPGHFYFNQKINCMRVSGAAAFGDTVWKFDPADSFATLDWGRGVWTYDNTWLWSSLNTALPDGSAFGWNLGYGFGDTSSASENMLIHNGKAHKLEEVLFLLPKKGGKDDFMAPWRFTSSDGRLEMDFAPVYDNTTPINIGVICMTGHQIFGKFTGRAVLDDGTVIEIADRMGFVEKFHNKW
ncbi:MAG: DUF2804 domain-containing protein [Oscillospiraceae bacterium]|jgi:hypothetical protein|nr:DUF2804 domain-containing protein [Oscillospiraceae bacterium]